MNQLIQVDEGSLAAFENVGGSIGAAAGNTNYMKFNKAGRFVYGAEDEELTIEQRFAIDMANMSRGFICWKEGTVAGEVMAKVMGEPAVNQADLPEYGPYEGNDGWRPQVKVELTDVANGTTYEFKSSSRGGISAIDKLGKDFAAQVRTGSKDVVPVVSLRSGSYKHKNKALGTIYTPHFDVEEWVGSAEADVVEGDVLN